MLIELAVRNLGVIEDISVVFGPGLTAMTGETGAGKTLLVSALELLVGGRADAAMVRAGADEAVVEGRFVDAGGTEVVLARVVPAEGRSRAYVDGRLAPVGVLGEKGADLVDLYGQHAHQSLLTTAAQRQALDAFAAIDLGPLNAAHRAVRETVAQLDAIGGDVRARAREIDLLEFQVEELDRIGPSSVDEDEVLSHEEVALAEADQSRSASARAYEALAGERGALDVVSHAVAALDGRTGLGPPRDRLRSLVAELEDVASSIRLAGEAVIDDPARLEEVRGRRNELRGLIRKYGATTAEVIEFAASARARLVELHRADESALELDAMRVEAEAEHQRMAVEVAEARRQAGPHLAEAVMAHVRELAMPHARVEVTVDGPVPSDEVTFMLAADRGSSPRPLAKVASGGELARTMLALRLVAVDRDARSLVFDEVDAGIGGAAAVAVGRALARVAQTHQVLVVTHLPQVAAFADAQVAVTKEDAPSDEGTHVAVARARVLDGEARVIELSRMLSGRPDSARARDHAEELLAARGAR